MSGGQHALHSEIGTGIADHGGSYLFDQAFDTTGTVYHDGWFPANTSGTYVGSGLDSSGRRALVIKNPGLYAITVQAGLRPGTGRPANPFVSFPTGTAVLGSTEYLMFMLVQSGLCNPAAGDPQAYIGPLSSSDAATSGRGTGFAYVTAALLASPGSWASQAGDGIAVSLRLWEFSLTDNIAVQPGLAVRYLGPAS